jgi:two-component system response regulator PilR (NtrC family)
MPFRSLIVEDDPDFAGLVRQVVETAGGQATVAGTIAQATAELARNSVDLVLLDNRLPDGTGYEFHAQLAARAPGTLAIMITGAPELAQAVALTRNGLFEYLTKPVDLDALNRALERAQLRLARPAPDPLEGEVLLVGGAPAFQQACQRLRDVASHPDAMVLLLGETGTGKDMAARQLHAWTHRNRAREAPFVALNCASVPGEMFEAELFGSERGAYTGADRRRTGMVEASDGGTLFLDEIGEVPSPQQGKLLRFLESREYRPLGSSTAKSFRGRIVAATNRDLREEVRQGRFRQDLLFRLDVIRVELPPLRTRLEDLPLLIEHLLASLGTRYGRPGARLRPADLDDLCRHTFPGNVRELRNILERSLLHTPAETPWLWLDRSWMGSPANPTCSPPASASPAPATAPAAAGESGSPPPAGGPSGRPPLTPLEQQEYEAFRQALLAEGGAIRRAAARLGVSHQVVLRRLRWWPELREFARSHDF